MAGHLHLRQGKRGGGGVTDSVIGERRGRRRRCGSMVLVTQGERGGGVVTDRCYWSRAEGVHTGCFCKEDKEGGGVDVKQT